MQGNPKPGEIYRHFKNKCYQVIAIAHHSETGEKLVVYQALYGEFGVCARPYDMFISQVDREKYPDVEQKYRFAYVGMAGENMAQTQLKKEAESISQQEWQREEKVGEQGQTESEEEEMPQEESANEKLLDFLDAKSYREKRNVLISMKKEINDDLINAMAASMDLIVEEGPIEGRYRSLLNCIETNMKFETNRFR